MYSSECVEMFPYFYNLFFMIYENISSQFSTTIRYMNAQVLPISGFLVISKKIGRKSELSKTIAIKIKMVRRTWSNQV